MQGKFGESSRGNEELKSQVGMNPTTRYQVSPSFNALVKSIVLVFKDFYFTPNCIQEAIFVAQKIIHDEKMMDRDG